MSESLLLLDLDGTIIDSAGDLAAAASEMVTSFGGRALAEDEVVTMVGEGAAVLVRRALYAAGVDPETTGALPRFLEIYDRRLLETTVAYEGIAEALHLAMRRWRLAVLTNKPLAPSRRILTALGLLSHFDAVIGGDSGLGRKPDPTGLLSLVRDARQVVLVGDSPVDWETTLAAGCTFVWARYGFGASRFAERPDTPYILDHASELTAILDRLTPLASFA